MKNQYNLNLWEVCRGYIPSNSDHKNSVCPDIGTCIVLRYLILILLTGFGLYGYGQGANYFGGSGAGNATAQNLNTLFTDVDTLFMEGAVPSHFHITDDHVTPIIATDSSNGTLYHFSVAGSYEKGKVIAIGHEALLADTQFNRNDNSTFILNAIKWLHPSGKRVLLKEGWIQNGNSALLQSMLAANSYTFNTLNSNISSASLVNSDILILGNDWNNNQAYTDSELAAIQSFVSNGGALFITGLGWSWPLALSDYPMNQVATLFGFEYTDTYYFESKLYNFYSESFTLSDLFDQVGSLYMEGAVPSDFNIIDPKATPIVSSNLCSAPTRHFSVAAEYENGKVLAIGHESLLADSQFSRDDNSVFVENVFEWFDLTDKKAILKEGYISNQNSTLLQNMLAGNGYSFSTLSGDITPASLANSDVLILGNDWNNNQAYTDSELAAIQSFVSNGGALFIAGLGWSWPLTIDNYPMNQVATLFGFEYTKTFISDSRYDNFYPDNINPVSSPYCPSPYLANNFSRGENLRVLKLAVSVNGEFTQQKGGVSNTSALIDSWLREINEYYGRELCVRFELIPNNDLLLFNDPDTDPWRTLPSGSGGCTNANIIFSDQANVIDGIIGAANYDLSHVIVGSPFGGGCAGGLKSGVSGGLNIPVTRHEIGHQLAQSHTVNHSNNINYEPENGAWTVHGGNSQPHLHAVSFHQSADYLSNQIANLGTKTPTGNTIPLVDAGQDYAIPISTPFTLTATASDPDGDTLTYVWDNMNPGLPQYIPVPDDSQGAIFMRLLPTGNPVRTFPRMSDVVANNNSNAQEQLPTQPRIMDIRLTVNDNHKILYEGEWVNASASNNDDIQITVANAGPFVVTSQNTAGVSYPGNSSQTVTWNVNGTDQAPINTQTVSIYLSTDGGYTYPFTVLQNTANTGVAQVVLPNVTTSNARFMVAADDNIYFDLNTADFEIQAVTELSTSIQPNPAETHFKLTQTLDGVRLDDMKVRILDFQGRTCTVNVINGVYDISGLSEGIYLVKMTNETTHEIITKKLVIHR